MVASGPLCTIALCVPCLCFPLLPPPAATPNPTPTPPPPHPAPHLHLHRRRRRTDDNRDTAIITYSLPSNTRRRKQPVLSDACGPAPAPICDNRPHSSRVPPRGASGLPRPGETAPSASTERRDEPHCRQYPRRPFPWTVRHYTAGERRAAAATRLKSADWRPFIARRAGNAAERDEATVQGAPPR